MIIFEKFDRNKQITKKIRSKVQNPKKNSFESQKQNKKDAIESLFNLKYKYIYKKYKIEKINQIQQNHW